MFWWKGMKEDVQQYAMTCLTCLRRRVHPKSESIGTLLTDRPGAIVAVDVVGPVTHRQQRFYILTMIDHFTKYAEATVLTEVRADTTWAAFYERWIAIWGCPTSLLSDNGPQFRAGEWQQQCSALGIKKIYTTPYHPQGDGIIEAAEQVRVEGDIDPAQVFHASSCMAS